MKKVANILWIIFGGFILFLFWVIAGIVLFLTIVGIPFGIQCFKFANLMICPFGREIIYENSTGLFLLNILWIITFGLNISLWSLIIGFFWCVTIVGIPIGLQVIKFAKLALMPFGAKVN